MNALDLKSLSFSDFLKWYEDILYPTLSYRSLEKDYSESHNTNYDICSICKGKCCKQCGCHFSPDDFEEITFDFLKEQIYKGYISIDWIDGDIICKPFNIYILRVRNQNAPIVDFGFKRTPCILLTKNGCKIDYNRRPTGGKLLIPSENYSCYSTYGMEKCSYEWEPHQKVLHDLIEYFMNFSSDYPCSLA